MQNTSNSHHIIIIGSGPGGLTLAQGLKRANIPFTIFERDASHDFRAQGYRLRIHENGAEALKKTLDPQLFDLFERTCGETRHGIANINALDGSVMIHKPLDSVKQSTKNAVPSAMKGSHSYVADRTTLRRVLMMGLEGHIVFGKEFKEYTLTSDGVAAHFTDGTTEKGTLLVAADGMRSRIRKQYLSDYVPVDTEGRAVFGKTVITDELKEKFIKEAMSGMNLIQEQRENAPLTLFLEAIYFPKDLAKESEGKIPNVQDYVYWVLVSRKDTFGLSDNELLGLSNKEAADLAVKLTEKWAPSVKSLIELQDKDQSAALRLASFRPAIPTWSPSAQVTLLGDAAHVMSPTGGLGANTALRDAANLCQAIVEGGATVESIGRYEEQMREDAKKAIEFSYFGGKKMYNQPSFEECKPLV